MVHARRRVRQVALALAVAMTVTVGVPLAFNFDGSIPGDKAVPAIEPDPRVRWESFPADGLSICNGDTCVTLPPGATLWVPFAVTDSTWDAD